MIDNKYNAIFCDLGNVLINFDHRLAVKKILHYTAKKEEDIYNLFFDSGLTKLYEEGKITSRVFFKLVKETLVLDMDYNSFFPIWDSIFFQTPLNIKMQNFLKAIKKQYKLIMISNINEAHFEFLRKSMAIFNEFDKLILSYEAGFRKPAPQIYKKALESVNTVPSKVLYIDDRRDLVEEAYKLVGIKGMVFDSEPGFEKIVKELCSDPCQCVP